MTDYKTDFFFEIEHILLIMNFSNLWDLEVTYVCKFLQAPSQSVNNPITASPHITICDIINYIYTYIYN